jgi:hypothetical protein
MNELEQAEQVSCLADRLLRKVLKRSGGNDPVPAPEALSEVQQLVEQLAQLDWSQQSQVRFTLRHQLLTKAGQPSYWPRVQWPTPLTQRGWLAFASLLLVLCSLTSLFATPQARDHLPAAMNRAMVDASFVSTVQPAVPLEPGAALSPQPALYTQAMAVGAARPSLTQALGTLRATPGADHNEAVQASPIPVPVPAPGN